ncbi:MAG: transcriptional regulator [Acidobacteria bacterium]|nr:MAG: transcriptional regulator [Acidobacteriota bacterium]
MAGVPRVARTPPKHPALRRLGTQIRTVRLERGFSQEALADTAGIARSYMSGIERGVRNFSVLHLLKISRALRVGVADLFVVK